MTVQTSSKNLLQKPSLLVNTPHGRKEGGRGRKKREGKNEGNKRCSQLRHKRPRTHQKGRAPSYDQSIQGHPRKKEGEERKERKKERKNPRSFGSPFIGPHRRFSFFSFMSFCLRVSSSSSFLSLARTIVRTLVCTHTRTRTLLTTRFRWPRFVTMRFGSSVVPLHLVLLRRQQHTPLSVSVFSFSSVPFALCAFDVRVGVLRLFCFPHFPTKARTPSPHWGR